MKRRPVQHEITLLAFSRDAETGCLCIYDIVETSFHYAYGFTRAWLRNSEIVGIAAGHNGRIRMK